MIEITAVACSRKGKFDAEVQLKYGTFDEPTYKQVVVSTGHPTREAAKEAAKVIASKLYSELTSRAISCLSRWPNAKP